MRNALLAGILLGTMGSAALAQEPGGKAVEVKPAEATEAEIRRLLEVTGSARIAQQVLATIIASIHQQQPEVPEEVWAEVLGEFKTEDVTRNTIPIYKKYLTGEDIRGLIAFYESPVGRKLIEVQPQIVQESMAIGQKWGEDAAQRVFKRLQDRGYLRKPSPPDL